MASLNHWRMSLYIKVPTSGFRGNILKHILYDSQMFPGRMSLVTAVTSSLMWLNCFVLFFSPSILSASWIISQINYPRFGLRFLGGGIQLEIQNIAYIFIQASATVLSKIGENSSRYFLCDAVTRGQSEKI